MIPLCHFPGVGQAGAGGRSRPGVVEPCTLGDANRDGGECIRSGVKTPDNRPGGCYQGGRISVQTEGVGSKQSSGHVGASDGFTGARNPARAVPSSTFNFRNFRNVLAFHEASAGLNPGGTGSRVHSGFRGARPFNFQTLYPPGWS